MISSISRLFILVFGTLYPAYASYKAVRTKNVREYVKWMMYWIVFAFFSTLETITDMFLAFWFPFYYQLKIGLVVWLLLPATEGSSVLYRRFVHPLLTKREQEIDEYLARAKEQGYSVLLELGTKGITYASQVVMQTAMKGSHSLLKTVRRSYSLSDLGADQVTDLNGNQPLPPPSDSEDEHDHPSALMSRPPARRSRSGTTWSKRATSMDTSYTEDDDEDLELSKPRKRRQIANRATGESESRSKPRKGTRREYTSGYESSEMGGGVSLEDNRARPVRTKSMNTGYQSATTASTTRSKTNNNTQVPSYATLPRTSTRRASKKRAT